MKGMALDILNSHTGQAGRDTPQRTSDHDSDEMEKILGRIESHKRDAIAKMDNLWSDVDNMLVMPPDIPEQKIGLLDVCDVIFMTRLLTLLNQCNATRERMPSLIGEFSSMNNYLNYTVRMKDKLSLTPTTLGVIDGFFNQMEKLISNNI